MTPDERNTSRTDTAARTTTSTRPDHWVGKKRYVEVFGRQMAYIERGHGRPILFLYGNPTSSFLWRNVLPYVEGGERRIIAPDLVGMGDSDKLLPGDEPDRYRFACHSRYLDAFIDQVIGQEPVILVVHDWGGALGFDWAARQSDRVAAVAYMETFVRPLALEDLPESFHPTLRAVRSSEGARLVLEDNMFIEQMLPGVTQRTLTESEMAEYRRPFMQAGDNRTAMLQWPREVPLSGEPGDVAERVKAYSNWLQTTPIPKLFIDVEPGVFITGDVRAFARSLPNQACVTVPGLHFVQEDSPTEVGQSLDRWLRKLYI
jgi:haloalkane dehalogenase